MRVERHRFCTKRTGLRPAENRISLNRWNADFLVIGMRVIIGETRGSRL